MAREQYDYRGHFKRPGEVDYTYRPLLDVWVSGETKTSLKTEALVDSGSEITVMNKEIADLLGITPEGKARGFAKGVGESSPGFLAKVNLQIDRFKEDILTFNVLFIEDSESDFSIMLGQEDFFRNFHVLFERDNKKFFLERTPVVD